MCGISWIIGGIWWGWSEFLLNKLGLILWGLFLNSIVLMFSLFMIAIVEIVARRFEKKELIKRYKKNLESNNDALAQSFQEESRRRNLDKLKRSEVTEFMIHSLSAIEQLSEQIEILSGRKPDYLNLIEDSIKSVSARRDKI